MRRSLQIARLAFLTVLLAAAAVVLIPSRYMPERAKGFTSHQGSFGNQSIEIRVPASFWQKQTVAGRLHMDEGTCEVSYVTPAGDVQPQFQLGEGSLRADLPPGTVVRLDPHGHAGRYEIFAGWEWHPLAPKGKMVLLSGVVVALLTRVVIRGQARQWLRNLPARPFLFFLAVTTVSGLFLYSIVHEFGHAATAVLLGGKVDRVAWTFLSGEHPHVSFVYLPSAATPWVSAGGVFAPTLAGIVLISIWMVYATRLGWYPAVGLLVPAFVLLMGNAGAIPEMILDEYGHMRALSRYYKLVGIEPYLVELAPLGVSILLYVFVAWRMTDVIKAVRARRAAVPQAPQPAVIPGQP